MNENARRIRSLRERVARLERLCARDTKTGARLIPRKLELEAELGELLAKHSEVANGLQVDVADDVDLEAELAQRLLTAHLERD